jgi:hypothetical protein
MAEFLAKVGDDNGAAPEPSTLEKIREGPLGRLGVSILIHAARFPESAPDPRLRLDEAMEAVRQAVKDMWVDEG